MELNIVMCLNCLSKLKNSKIVRRGLEVFCLKKKYLEATQSLERSLTRLDGGLKSVEGLSEIKEVLVNQKETLYSKLLEDLSKQIFTESTWEVLKSKQDQTPFQRTASNQGSRGSKRGSGTPLSGSGRKSPNSIPDQDQGVDRKGMHVC